MFFFLFKLVGIELNLVPALCMDETVYSFKSESLFATDSRVWDEMHVTYDNCMWLIILNILFI